MDPFKEMVRKYDAAIVRKGGRSLFSLTIAPPLVGTGIPDGRVRPALPKMSADDLRHYLKARRVLGSRKAQQMLPGRIVGTITGKLGGFMDDLES